MASGWVGPKSSPWALPQRGCSPHCPLPLGWLCKLRGAPCGQRTFGPSLCTGSQDLLFPLKSREGVLGAAESVTAKRRAFGLPGEDLSCYAPPPYHNRLCARFESWMRLPTLLIKGHPPPISSYNGRFWPEGGVPKLHWEKRENAGRYRLPPPPKNKTKQNKKTHCLETHMLTPDAPRSPGWFCPGGLPFLCQGEDPPINVS